MKNNSFTIPLKVYDKYISDLKEKKNLLEDEIQTFFKQEYVGEMSWLQITEKIKEREITVKKLMDIHYLKEEIGENNLKNEFVEIGKSHYLDKSNKIRKSINLLIGPLEFWIVPKKELHKSEINHLKKLGVL